MPLNQRELAELGAISEIGRLTTEILAIVSEFPKLAPAASTRLAHLLKNGRPPRPTTPTPQLTFGHELKNGAKAKRSTMSAQTRKKMAASMRKRWAAAKKAGKSTLQEAAASAK